MIRLLGITAALAGAAGVLVGVGGPAGSRHPEVVLSSVTRPVTEAAARPVVERSTTKPLAGVRIALDPGHQLGNHNFPRQINKQVPAGGFTKPCNTTGTATNSGYPEATFNFTVMTLVKKKLEALGATVLMTRNANSQKLWGPCVNTRGEFGKKVKAALEVSLHADGAKASGHGFHVIAPTSRKPWTTDIAKPSLVLAKALRSGLLAHGLKRSNYLAGGTGLVTRSDLGTLNMSDVPIAMIEIGNMRNAGDAAQMKSATGRARFAAAIVTGIRDYLKI